MSRKRIFDIIEKAEVKDTPSKIYDSFMIVVIALSLMPMAFKTETPLLRLLDRVTVIVFIIDYLLRWYTADYKFGEHSFKSFVRYPISAMALIDLLSIIPSLGIFSASARAISLLKALRVIRVFKAARYFRSLSIIGDVFKASKGPLTAVVSLAAVYILVSALVVFNVEPDTFDSFFEAVYYSTVSLTTVGYGDIYPVSTVGRFFSMMSSVFGIAIIALPSGIITAGYMKALADLDEDVDHIDYNTKYLKTKKLKKLDKDDNNQ